MSQNHLLIGLDFGTTTSYCVIAQATVQRNSVLGRSEFSRREVLYQSKPVFTPIENDRVDFTKIRGLLQQWKRDSQLDWSQMVGGGALLTGLTARSQNAPEFIALLRSELPGILVINAEDPHLESWVSCTANCNSLMQASPEKTFLNYDIGGGTTNLGVCRQGEVLGTDWFLIGARHLILRTGTYVIETVTQPGEKLLQQLSIEQRVDDSLSPEDVQKICAHYVEQMETSARRHPSAHVVFSGGVGELLYRPAPAGIAPYGDLGGDLAQAIRKSPLLSRDLASCIPESLGRATVFGMALHSTQIGGDSIYASHPESFPLEVPVRGTLTDGKVREPGAYFIHPDLQNAASLKKLATQIAREIKAVPSAGPYIFLMEANLGKVFGNRIALEQKIENPVIVIDEIVPRPAHFLVLGRMIGQNTPVTLYGFNQ